MDIFIVQVMREVGWVVFDEIHYMRDPGECTTVLILVGVGNIIFDRQQAHICLDSRAFVLPVPVL